MINKKFVVIRYRKLFIITSKEIWIFSASAVLHIFSNFSLILVLFSLHIILYLNILISRLPKAYGWVFKGRPQIFLSIIALLSIQI